MGAHIDLGDHAGARALPGDTLTRRRRVLGEDHPATLDPSTASGGPSATTMPTH
ncbi:tetratricopeptide repeat protein [Parafrankia sp. FMc2]|uniref:tetratricopeptide repeat protein n=1 Tax=Parafrankia sp. FMc2 TaxID=3233196 RepID=UPI0034D52D7C